MSAEELAALQAETFAASPPATATSYPPERRLSGAALRAVLTSGRYATVSTTRPDGRPHCAPSSFTLHGTEIWLPTVAGAVRLRNVRANPYAVVCVTEGVSGTHLAVIAEGPVRVSSDPPPGAEVKDWMAEWIVVTMERLLSYAAEDARP